MSKYCKWYCIEYVDTNKWLFKSECGETKIISKNSKLYKHIYKENDLNLCPNCNKPITVGMQID